MSVTLCVSVRALHICFRDKTEEWISVCVTVNNRPVTEGYRRAALSLWCWWFMSVILQILLSVTQSQTSLCRLQHTFWDIINWCQTDRESRQSVIWPTAHSQHWQFPICSAGEQVLHRNKMAQEVTLMIPSSPFKYRAEYTRCDLLLKLVKKTYSCHKVANYFL